MTKLRTTLVIMKWYFQEKASASSHFVKIHRSAIITCLTPYIFLEFHSCPGLYFALLKNDISDMHPVTVNLWKVFVYGYFIQVNIFYFSSVIHRSIHLFYKDMISSCCLAEDVMVKKRFYKVFHCSPRKLLWKLALPGKLSWS